MNKWVATSNYLEGKLYFGTNEYMKVNINTFQSITPIHIMTFSKVTFDLGSQRSFLNI